MGTGFDWKAAAAEDSHAGSIQSHMVAWTTVGISLASVIAATIHGGRVFRETSYAERFITLFAMTAAEMIVGLVVLFIAAVWWLGGAGPLLLGVIRVLSVFCIMNTVYVLMTLGIPTIYLDGGLVYVAAIIALRLLFSSELEVIDAAAIGLAYVFIAFGCFLTASSFL